MRPFLRRWAIIVYVTIAPAACFAAVKMPDLFSARMISRQPRATIRSDKDEKRVLSRTRALAFFAPAAYAFFVSIPSVFRVFKVAPFFFRCAVALLVFHFGILRGESANFTNEGGDALFSTPANWTGGNLPSEGDRVNVAGNTATDKPALVDPDWTSKLGNVFISAARGGYAKVMKDGALKFDNLGIGGSGPQWTGQVTVLEGGKIEANFANSGMLVIGGGVGDGSKEGEGILVLHGGSLAGKLAGLRITPQGTLEFVANENGFAEVLLHGDNIWSMDGRLKIDLSKLGNAGKFPLISHEADGKPGAVMSGALMDWLKSGSGKQSGKGDGDFGSGVLEIAGSKGKAWELTCDGDSAHSELTFTVK